MLVGCFQVVEYISWKFILTSLSISRRPLKERIFFPACKLLFTGSHLEEGLAVFKAVMAKLGIL